MSPSATSPRYALINAHSRWRHSPGTLGGVFIHEIRQNRVERRRRAVLTLARITVSAFMDSAMQASVARCTGLYPQLILRVLQNGLSYTAVDLELNLNYPVLSDGSGGEPSSFRASRYSILAVM